MFTYFNRSFLIIVLATLSTASWMNASLELKPNWEYQVKALDDKKKYRSPEEFEILCKERVSLSSECCFISAACTILVEEKKEQKFAITIVNPLKVGSEGEEESKKTSNNENNITAYALQNDKGTIEEALYGSIDELQSLERENLRFICRKKK